jgi:single-stranded-DNA-specific exonuclease
VAAGRKICVYGDYDVDGTTAVAVLLGILRAIGADPAFYEPNRTEEGYGLNAEAVRGLAAAGVQVLVTVDCGITAVAEVAAARRLGLEVIVTDHHEFGPELPPADVLVHPRLPGGYPFDVLCGAGVALKLAWAVAQRASGGGEKVSDRFRTLLMDLMAYAALGLIADVVPLRDENRSLARHGLRRLGERPGVGLKALIAAAKLDQSENIRAEDVGFKLAPRLNAAGRLECARLVVELLTTDSPVTARQAAEYLEGLNQKRQGIERKAVAQAKQMVEANGYHDRPAIVLGSPDWHQGVIGIVAGRLAEHYGRPTLLVAERADDEVSTGSARSAGLFPLHAGLAACAAHLEGFGGHAAAAGFRVRPGNLPALREAFCTAVAAASPDGPPPPRLLLDAEVPLSALTFKLLAELDKLEPYGADNPRPKFLAADVRLEGTPRRMGQEERHLSFKATQGGVSVRAVGWGMGDRLDELMSGGGRCCLAFVPRLNTWNGHTTVEMEVCDLQPGPTPRLG